MAASRSGASVAAVGMGNDQASAVSRYSQIGSSPKRRHSILMRLAHITQ
jgi:hypothetical protein